jgi:vesicle-associated membrane protein 7
LLSRGLISPTKKPLGSRLPSLKRKTTSRAERDLIPLPAMASSSTATPLL